MAPTKWPPGSEVDALAEKALLFDFYGPLLTAKQSRVWDSYYHEDYSLAEVAAEEGISRQAVHALLKRTADNLEDYEARMQLVARFQAGRHSLRQADEALLALTEDWAAGAQAVIQEEGLVKRLDQVHTLVRQALNNY